MKTKALSVLAGVAAPLIAAGTADAGFVGIKVVAKQGNVGGTPALVCNVFATFDRPGEDRFLAAAGTPASPMDIHVVGGTFYQNAFGADTAPNALLIGAFPSLAFDSFVTIGQKSFGTGGNGAAVILTLTPGWPGFAASSLGLPDPLGENMGWAVTPNDPNSDPFNPVYHLGNGQVLIGQFTTTNGSGIGGSFRVLVVSNGVSTQLDVSFFHVPSPGALALLGTAGLVGRRRRRRA